MGGQHLPAVPATERGPRRPSGVLPGPGLLLDDRADGRAAGSLHREGLRVSGHRRPRDWPRPRPLARAVPP
ncbi:MAG: hypothetical protein AAF329_11805 [Cyanobacteria bacterium P01_A01_bin.17]